MTVKTKCSHNIHNEIGRYEMTKRYSIETVRSVTYSIEIEANSKEEAVEKAFEIDHRGYPDGWELDIDDNMECVFVDGEIYDNEIGIT